MNLTNKLRYKLEPENVNLWANLRKEYAESVTDYYSSPAYQILSNDLYDRIIAKIQIPLAREYIDIYESKNSNKIEIGL